MLLSYEGSLLQHIGIISYEFGIVIFCGSCDRCDFGIHHDGHYMGGIVYYVLTHVHTWTIPFLE